MKEQIITIKRKQISWDSATIELNTNEEIEIEDMGIILAEALAQHLKIVRESIDKIDAKLYNQYVKLLLDEITKTIIDV